MAPAAPAPGSICPTCGQKVRGPSVIRRAARAVRVFLHDPVVDRSGKTLASILVVRALVAVGASDGLVQIVRAALRAKGL